MNTQETFYLNKLRCEVAFQQALSSWQPPLQLEGIECPRCQSRKIVKRGRERGKQRYICRGCQRAFTERCQFKCDCEIPGRLLKCQDCPEFMQFLSVVKQKADTLRGLNQEELRRILSDESQLME
jgi:DNA-directed RNA polymerase subunit RPC12/RpoP